VAATGAALGLALGLLGHRVMLVVFDRLTGMSVHYRFVLWPTAIAITAALALTALGAALPARRAARLNVIEAIGYE
jgi:putative ABC transport system permease protein